MLLGETPEDYDMIIIGTPIWSEKMTPAVRAYLTNYHLTSKKVAFFTTQGGDEPVEAIAEMEEMAAESEVIGALSIRQDDVKANRYEARLMAFVERLKQ